MNKLIRRAILSWQSWRDRQRIRRAYPVLRDLDRMQAEYRRTHKRGSARIIKAKRDAIHAALAGKAVP